jgi:hypothetical protein
MHVPALTDLMTLRVELGAPSDVGSALGPHRRVFPIVGGSFEGERLRGRVVAPGLDCAIVRSDGSAVLDVRLVLETDRGALVHLTYTGIRRGPPEILARLARGEDVDPRSYYLRIAMRFETRDPELAWLEGILAIGAGERRPSEIVYRVLELA